jgi:hypothetical protein
MTVQGKNGDISFAYSQLKDATSGRNAWFNLSVFGWLNFFEMLIVLKIDKIDWENVRLLLLFAFFNSYHELEI